MKKVEIWFREKFIPRNQWVIFTNFLWLLFSACLFSIDIGASARPRSCPHSIYADKYDCTRFYLCQSGRAERMSCPYGLHFNPDLLVCDYKQNIRENPCGESQERAHHSHIYQTTTTTPYYSISTSQSYPTRPTKTTSFNQRNPVVSLYEPKRIVFIHSPDYGPAQASATSTSGSSAKVPERALPRKPGNSGIITGGADPKEYDPYKTVTEFTSYPWFTNSDSDDKKAEQSNGRKIPQGNQNNTQEGSISDGSGDADENPYLFAFSWHFYFGKKNFYECTRCSYVSQ